MPRPKLPVLAIAACAVASAITSCSGNLASGTTSDAGPDVDAAPVGAPPKSALRQVSLAMTRVNFGDSPTPDAWKQIGFNLDGKVTTATSTDVCQLVSGASLAEQDDGLDGIDNSFGENSCPILDSLGASCSSSIPRTYVVSDASGSGTLTIQFAIPKLRWEIPITDAHVVLNADGTGMLGAVAPTAGFINTLLEAVAAFTSCGPGHGQPESLLTQYEQTSDFLSDGSNSAGQQCDAISIGMQFWDATPFDGVLPDLPDACAD